MEKTCKLELCVIGSTNFGKSSIAASLIGMAGRTDGCINLLGSQRKINELADELSANGILHTTSWDDIEKFTFKLQGSDGRAWRIALRDYPGALFAKYVEQPNIWERVKRVFAGKARATIDKYTFDPTAEQKAVKLIRKLERADALIVLVPADITDAKYGQDRRIYGHKLPEFIEKVLKKKPHTPVCLCINKWDMFDIGIDKLADKLKEPPFSEFYQSLKWTCESELSVAALSAFGCHDPTDKEKFDRSREQKPVNVLETLLVLAEKAEKARYERAIEEWQQSSWWKKMLIAPFKLMSLVRAGSTDSVIRTGLLKMAAKAWGFFGLFVLAVTTAILLLTSVYNAAVIDEAKVFCIRDENRSIDPWRDFNQCKMRAISRTNCLEVAIRRLLFLPTSRELNSLLSRDVKILSDLDRNSDIYKTASSLLKDCGPQVSPDIARFIRNKESSHPELANLFSALRNHQTDIEKSYSDKLERKINEYNNAHPNVGMSAVQKVEHDKQLIEIINAAEGQFEEGSVRFKRFSDLRAQLSDDEGRQKKYGPFDEGFNRIQNLDRRGKLREIRKFLNGHLVADYPARETELGILRKEEGELIAWITNTIAAVEKDSSDDDHLSAKMRIKYANERKRIYDWAAKEFVAGSQEQLECQKKSSMEDPRIHSWEKYVPLEEAYDEIKEAQLSKVLKLIAKFQSQYKLAEYPDAGAKINEIEKLRNLKELEVEKERGDMLKALEAKIPAETNFLAMVEYYSQRKKIAERYSDYFPKSSMPAEINDQILRSADSNRKTYERLSRLAERVSNLKVEWSKPSQNPRLLMSSIRSILEDFPRTNNMEVIASPLYEIVVEIQGQAEEAIVKSLEERLRQNPVAGTGNERQQSLIKRLDLIEPELPFLQGTRSGDMYRSLVSNYRLQIDAKIERDRIEKQMNNLIGAAQNPRNNDQMALKIKTFLDSNGEMEKCFPTGFRELRILKGRCIAKDKWSQQKVKIEEHLANRPENISDMAAYQDETDKYLQEIKKHKDPCISNDVDSMRKKLEESFKSTEAIIGRGSIDEIRRREREYKYNPTREAYETLTKLFIGFRPERSENKDHLDEFNIIKNNVTQDRSDREKISQTWDKLSSTTDDYQRLWHDFKGACENYFRRNEYSSRVSLEPYRQKYERIIRNVSLKIKFMAVSNFKLRWFSDVAGAKRARFYYYPVDFSDNTNGRQMWFDIKYATKLSDWSWKDGMEFEHQEKSTSLEHSLMLNVDQPLLHFRLYCIGNWSNERGNNFDDFEVNIIPALVKLAEDRVSSATFEYSGSAGMKIGLQFTRQ